MVISSGKMENGWWVRDALIILAQLILSHKKLNNIKIFFLNLASLLSKSTYFFEHQIVDIVFLIVWCERFYTRNDIKKKFKKKSLLTRRVKLFFHSSCKTDYTRSGNKFFSCSSCKNVYTRII